jgi:hypothetical protein
MNKQTLILAVVAYVLSSAVSFSYFRNSQPAPVAPTTPIGGFEDLLFDIDPSAPRTETCPLNGAFYTKVERQAWEERRPLAVMVENSPDARPHSGIIRADIVYEAVAEGGVTRFMPVFLCDVIRNDVKIAPVRSVRTYFIDWASEYGGTPLFAHVGGANCSAEKLENGNFGPCKTDPRAQAIEQLGTYGWRYAKGNDLDQFAIGAPTYIRNETRTGKVVATEHSVVASSEGLWQVGLDRGWTNKDLKGVEWTKDYRPWKFQDDAPSDKRGQTTTINHDFWTGHKQFDVRWEYDREQNRYLRFTGGEAHTDLETKDQLFAKNVVVQLTKEIGPVGDLKHMLYTTIGEGDALIFQNGQAIKGSWKKDSRTGRTIFYDQTRKEIEFVRGLIWISIVPDDTTVAY